MYVHAQPKLYLFLIWNTFGILLIIFLSTAALKPILSSHDLKYER